MNANANATQTASNLNDQLIQAVLGRQPKQVDELLARGANPYQIGSSGVSALTQWEAERGRNPWSAQMAISLLGKKPRSAVEEQEITGVFKKVSVDLAYAEGVEQGVSKRGMGPEIRIGQSVGEIDSELAAFSGHGLTVDKTSEDYGRRKANGLRDSDDLLVPNPDGTVSLKTRVGGNDKDLIGPPNGGGLGEYVSWTCEDYRTTAMTRRDSINSINSIDSKNEIDALESDDKSEANPRGSDNKNKMSPK